jgi:hypothetical protein
VATIVTTADGIAVELGRWERLGALHGSVRIPWTRVESVEHVVDLWPYVRGLRVGTGFPYVVLLGTMYYRGGKDFCAVYGKKPGVIISTTAGEFSRVLVTARSTPDLEAWTAHSLKA